MKVQEDHSVWRTQFHSSYLFFFVFFENYICDTVLNCSVFPMFLYTEFVQMMTGK